VIFVVSEEMGVKIVNIQLAGGHTLLNKEVFRFHSFIHACKNDKNCKDATFLEFFILIRREVQEGCGFTSKRPEMGAICQGAC